MLRRNADHAFTLFQRTGSPKALARVFARTAPELLAVARHLANGEAAAEDLLQATFVTAIEAAASHRPGEPVLPWLMGILGNHARVARRKARRPVDVGRVTREDAIDPSAEAEQRELSSTVRQAIADLPEPYRPVLRMYLEHGLEPVEIARTLERAPGTVRAQVSRGLDRLRASLPAALSAGVGGTAIPGRGLAAVREAVLSRCRTPPPTVTATAAVASVTVMNWKLLTVTAALVAAFSGYYVVDGRRRDELGAPAIGTPPALVGDGADTANGPGQDMPAAAAPPDAARTVVPSPTATAAKEKVTALRVRVRSATTRTMLAGVGVRLNDDIGLGTPDASDPVLTDVEGAAVFGALKPGTYWVSVERAGQRLMTTVTDGQVREVTMTIPAGITVEGVVHDAVGQPVAGAQVLAHALSLVPEVLATADPRGRYRVTDLAAGVALQARAHGVCPSPALQVRGRPGSTVELDLNLGVHGRRIVGQVRRSDGSVAAGVRVACARQATTPFVPAVFALADQDGCFVIDEADADALVVVALPAATAGDVAQAVAVGPGASDVAVDIRLCRGASLHGIVALDGEPGGITVQAWAAAPVAPMGYLTNVVGMRRTHTRADGSYEIDGLLPGSHELSAQRVQILAKTTMTIRAGGEHEWSPHQGDVLPVRVQISPPTPPAAVGPVWSVRLYRRDSDGNLEFANFGAPDAGGVVSFHAPDSTASYDVVVAVLQGGKNDLVVARLQDVRPQAGAHALRIGEAAMPSVHVRGRVVSAQGEPRADQAVSLRANLDDRVLSCASAVTDADGRFDLGPLPPGTWHLRLGEQAEIRPVGTFVLAAGDSADAGDVIVR